MCGLALTTVTVRTGTKCLTIQALAAPENVTDFLSSTLPQAMDSENTENGISAGINNNESDVLSLYSIMAVL